MSPTTRIPLFDVEEKIALLEFTNKRLSVELEEIRGALVTEREIRDCVSPPPRDPSDQPPEQSEVLWERNLRMEILEVLKKVRTQNTVLSRSVREYEEQCDSLSSLLTHERAERETAQDEISRLSQVNFTLLEHNKLLVGRDLNFQKMTSLALPGDPSLYQKGPDTSTGSLGEEDSLRSKLNSASDELHITRLRLAAEEEKSAELYEHVSFLQKQMSQCLDSSAQALEVERELRAEFMGRANAATEENAALRAKVDALGRRLAFTVSSVKIRRRVPLPQRISNRLHSRRQTRAMVATYTVQHKVPLIHQAYAFL